MLPAAWHRSGINLTNFDILTGSRHVLVLSIVLCRIQVDVQMLHILLHKRIELLVITYDHHPDWWHILLVFDLLDEEGLDGGRGIRFIFTEEVGISDVAVTAFGIETKRLLAS